MLCALWRALGLAGAFATVGIAACDRAARPVDECSGAARVALLQDTTRALLIGATEPLAAQAMSHDGQSLPAKVAWTTSDASIVDIALPGYVTKKPGEATLTASACGLTATTTVVVFPAYSVSEISMLVPAPNGLRMSAINDSLELVGTRLIDGAWKGFLYSDGVVTDLPCEPSSINTQKQVGCLLATPASPRAPAIWENGTTTELISDGSVAQAVFVTDSGIIAGMIESGPRGKALFRVSNAGIEWLETIYHYDLVKPNARGDLPYRTGDLAYPDGAIWMSDGSNYVLRGRGRYSRVNAINDSMMAVGGMERDALQGEVAITLRRLETGAFGFDTLTLNVPLSRAVAVNNAGTVVGVSSPFIWRRGRWIALQRLVPTEWTLTDATAITTSGVILGAARRGGSTTAVPVLLAPLP